MSLKLSATYSLEIRKEIIDIIELNLIKPQVLSLTEFTDDSTIQQILNRYYYCPICKKLEFGWSLYEYYEDGIIKRRLYLDCTHSYEYGTIGYIELPIHPIVVVWMKAEVHSQDRQLTKLYQRSHSFLNAFIQAMYGMLNGSNVTIPDVTNTGQSFWQTDSGSTTPLNIWASVNAGASDSTYGIVIGTGTTANSTSTYALASIISNGTGSGQMQYGAMSVSSLSISGSTISIPLSRTMTNNSGATINVAEAGIYVRQQQGTTNLTWCWLRDLFSAVQAVANGNSITINWQVQITVS